MSASIPRPGRAAVVVLTLCLSLASGCATARGGGGEGGDDATSTGSDAPTGGGSENEGTTFCAVVETVVTTCPGSPPTQDTTSTSTCEENVAECDDLVPADRQSTSGDCDVTTTYGLSEQNPGGEPHDGTCADYHAWNDVRIDCLDDGDCSENGTCDESHACLCGDVPFDGGEISAPECVGDRVVVTYDVCTADGRVDTAEELIRDCATEGLTCAVDGGTAECRGAPPGG